MNVWHDIAPRRITPTDFEVCVEIEKGSKVKYELDKETGLMRLDRILYTSTHYPANYGFIPRTYADDLDPLDVLVVCTEQIYPSTLVRCYPIGMIAMMDSGRIDAKIIAIPFDEPTYNHVRELQQLPAHTFAEMKHFFSVYKALEEKETAVDEIQGVQVAIDTIAQAIRDYQKLFPDH